MTSANHSVLTATSPVVRALLDEARRKHYSHGVLGVRAQPRWDGPDTFIHEGVPVRVVPCVSALAVREALLDRDPAGWLVLLTDRDDADLGAGVLAHLVGHRVRTPDPWQAVAARFAASGIDARLVSRSAQRDLATGLLAVTPAEGWPPAPGGVLTRDHTLGAVAQHHLHLGVGGAVGEAEMDAVAVFRWSTEPDSAARLADLREAGGDTLTDELLSWLANRCGAAAGSVLALLRAGRLSDLVPLGVVAGVIAGEGVPRDGDLDRVGADARIRLESRLGGVPPGRPELIGWGRDAATVAGGLLLDPQTHGAGQRVIARADALLVDLRAEPLAEASELLRSGLTERLIRLATALRSALNTAVPHDVDSPWVQPQYGADIEVAWDAVAGHRLGDGVLDHRVPVFRAAVRLARWLATPVSTSADSLTALIDRHRDADAWVDSAINDAEVGVGDPDLRRALGAVLEAAWRRRDGHDRTFAEALAAHTASQDPDPVVRHLENLLPEVVLPLTRHTPVLLLVMDGMSVGVATEVMSSALDSGAQGWVEALLPGAERRSAALAVFPTLTEISRASLLSATLVTGAQPQEHRGFSAAVRAEGLTGRLFHKKPLDVSQPGFAVADDVGAAIDDVEGMRLVACVLNTIDDALDRSDPAGTAWSVDAVKHLAPLLERAGRTGRTVVLTADHGHIVERRTGTQRSYPDISSSRSRAAGTAGEGEILLAGPRVLAHGGRAVLAVEERLRYGPLKAGYHGGASPAEAVVPVCVLVPGDVPEGSDLVLAAPQEPGWWAGPVRGGAAVVRQPLTLFDEPIAEPAVGAGLAAAVLRSRSFARQRALAGRGITMEHLESLLAALLDAPDRRLAPAAAAATAGIPVSRLRGAVAQAQRLLNVEGYPVLRLDVDGATVVLDEALLREQFDV